MDPAILVGVAVGTAVGVSLAAAWILAVHGHPAVDGVKAVAALLAAMCGVVTVVAMLVQR